jgi:hypothetical protein
MRLIKWCSSIFSERQLKIYEKVLYSGSSTSKGLPQLSPPQLVEVMTRLEAMLGRLETAIRATINDVEQKKKVRHHFNITEYVSE